MVNPDLRVAAVAAPLRMQLVDTLRRAILGFRFKPGERLVEREICELTGVSRTSLREALRQLESEGLVTIIPNRGSIVSIIDEAEARQIYELRALLEGFASRKFAERATNQQAHELQKALASFRDAVACERPHDLLAAKSDFYDLLMTGSGNMALEASLRNLHSRVNLLRATSMAQPGRTKKSISELEEIVDAIVARDPDRASRAAHRHVENAAKVVLGAIANKDWGKTLER